VNQSTVNFVGQDEEIMPDANVGNGFEILPAEDTASRVCWKIQQENLGSGSDCAFYVDRVQSEISGGFGLDRHAFAVSCTHGGTVRNVRGLMKNDFVSWIQQGAQRDV